MKTEMTKSVGFDEFYESGGGMIFFSSGIRLTHSKCAAVDPEVAATSTLDFLQTLTQEQSGTFWAPRGPRLVEFFIVLCFEVG
jgi:hypothetical protein